MPNGNNAKNLSEESKRLEESQNAVSPWRKWGPYLSERQWGTVREDYSDDGNAWNYFSHDQSRSRAYRWGEDGIGGISDDKQHVCFALALWNEKDPILKERLFGLTNSEGNHGEDVKEYYYYLDSTPTHSYMKFLYKYPQSAYPYGQLIEGNKSRGRQDFEYELIDTGIFDDDRYFDVQVEYAKESPETILVKITIFNRGPEAASLRVLPTIWFRNTWSWGEDISKPILKKKESGSTVTLEGSHTALGTFTLECEGGPELLFTENETNEERIFGTSSDRIYYKDAFHNYLIGNHKGAVNPAATGTKACAHYRIEVGAREARVLRLRLTVGSASDSFPSGFENMMALRQKEADEFYHELIPGSMSADEANVVRQALAGLLWSKQFYHYDVSKWLRERGVHPLKDGSKSAPRNDQWHHMVNNDIISMPDKWEYPWYASWDLAFHVLPLTLVDPEFGKDQLRLMLHGMYIHPNGQVPAYEWNFGDVNPPVLAWSTIFTYRLDRQARGVEDVEWLKSNFKKLLLNFTWWVNRKDRTGRNAFEGGFLGLDNIGVFDRSAALPTGGYLEQADGTAWMSIFSQNMFEIASEIVLHDRSYLDMALKFAEHNIMILASMMRIGNDVGMWDEEDGFFYDVLRLPDGSARRLKVRSVVGLLPLCAATVFDGIAMKKYPEIRPVLERFLEKEKDILGGIHDPLKPGINGRVLAAALNEQRLRRVLKIMLDENEFLSDYGIRALSKYHEQHPYHFDVGGLTSTVKYLPGESDSGMFGGNSNWRGPIWMPVNVLVIRALYHYYSYYGDSFKIEFPTGSGKEITLWEVARNISGRLANIFLKDKNGRRPVFGGSEKFQTDPFWKDHLLFYEYFQGDNGAGLGASHQTGWTGCVARNMHLFATTSAEKIQKYGKDALHVKAAQ
jgi:hypothetical protein